MGEEYCSECHCERGRRAFASLKAEIESMKNDLYKAGYENGRKHGEESFTQIIDNVREALGLESTHYLVIADQVRDVVKARDAALKELAEEQRKRKELGHIHGHFCEFKAKLESSESRAIKAEQELSIMSMACKEAEDSEDDLVKRLTASESRAEAMQAEINELKENPMHKLLSKMKGQKEKAESRADSLAKKLEGAVKALGDAEIAIHCGDTRKALEVLQKALSDLSANESDREKGDA